MVKKFLVAADKARVELGEDWLVKNLLAAVGRDNFVKK